MTIDANLIEGFKLGFAAGFILGAIVMIPISVAALRHLDKRRGRADD